MIGKNTALDKTTLHAAPGKVTFTFLNQDSGLVHNFHVYRGTDATGESVGQTELKAGPATDTLSATFAAGTYHYQCDAHPDQMNGTLTVR